MKPLITISLCLSLLMFQSFIIPNINDNYVTSTILDCDSIPQLNKEIIDFVKSKLNKKVGRGQCWDLAAAALKSVNAQWDGAYKFGRVVEMAKECVYPGDIIQFEGVKVEYTKNKTKFQEDMSHHTAIVYKVNSSGNFDLIHQNLGYGVKKVGITNLDIKNITRGRFIIYRPTQ